MKKTNTRKQAKAKTAKEKPAMKWQTGDYNRDAEFKFPLPYQFLLLCKLMDITPESIIRDFTDNLGCSSLHRQGRDTAKEHLFNYFIAHGYGQQHYTETDIRSIFTEMDALSLLFPCNGNMKLIDCYDHWRSKHYRYWFKKWFRKPRRLLHAG